jgi:hypothetical protein
MTKTIKLERARAWLAAVWFIGSAVVFALLVAQSLNGLYLDQLEKAWAWALPNIAPTLSLMVSVFAAYALIAAAEEDKYEVRKTFLTLSLGLSIFYILNLLVVIGSAPFSANKLGTNPVDVMHTSNFWLGPLQGLTSAALAALFFTKTESR